MIVENPVETKYGEITEMHTRLLEADIEKCPEYWLWTHKRWKRTKPDDYEEKQRLRLQQETSNKN